MKVIRQLRVFKDKIDNGEPSSHSIKEISAELPIRYRTHLLCAWNRYTTSRNTYVLTEVLEQLIRELESEHSVTEHRG